MKMEKLVLEAYKSVIEEAGKSVDNINLDIEVSRENGLDSLGFVEFIIVLEEKTGKKLDPVLSQIRKSKNLKEIVDVLNTL
ncbi:acyl carrier protein [uncultured Clostridium sp.]|uniref:acyl carrier protein n=1 Tax=uncultured Clostridium sp. TaxID=59620 RepID=UPI0025D4261B|nr:acyl carrier protein [uncultured Clostridium sp.]